MKKFYITLLTFIIAALQVFAAPVDPEKALEIANDFWRSNILTRKKSHTFILQLLLPVSCNVPRHNLL